MDVADRIDVTGITEQRDKSGEAAYSALPGLVREIIHTPAFKELVHLHLRDIEPENAAELIKALLWEDPGFSMGVMGASPQLVNWLARALIELGVQLNNFTAAILKDFLSKLGGDIDKEKLKGITGAYAPLVNELLLEDREALDALIAGVGSLAEQMAGAAERTWRKVWNTADFGKIRVGLTAHLEGRREELAGGAEIFNPVAISNLVGVVPPLVNLMLRVFTRVLQALGLPPEILANALFQLLEDVDKREVAGLVNALADLINALHRGNLVLGRDEPRFKEVAARISKELVESVDGERLKAAALALGEDGKVIGEVISGYLFATPESTVQVIKALHAALNAGLRAVAENSRRLSKLPPDAMADLAGDFGERLEARELGWILNNFMVIYNRICEQDPDIVSGTLIKTFAAVDPEVWATASKNTVLQVRDAVMAAPQIHDALRPESVGRNINDGLAAFNRYAAENPELIEERVSETLAVVDTYELRRALERLLTAMTRAVTANPGVIMAVLKPILVGMFKAVGGLVANLGPVKRLRERGIRRGLR